MKDNYLNTLRPAVGCYSIIRSSEDEGAMINWNKPEYDENCNRWFESCGCGFACWRDGQALQEADDMEVWEFRRENPNICVRESYCEIEYGKRNNIIKNVNFLLLDYCGKRNRSFSFEISNVSKEELIEWEVAVRNWHATGDLQTEHFYCSSMHWNWSDNKV